ncbi:GNAT family N-acetyltransferase [Mumia sp. ZJ430]|uniref:GNAT family N-acetyltransferase n=1 Tax=Mumia sp. ZJ430 TaxID=2708083 RepID=UPI001FBA71FD|nr:GNAT family N-acetyltransferase [Mumia sp. ZJ430]
MTGAAPVVLTTARLILRGWTDDDRPAFAALNADPRVMEHFPSTLTREQSDAMVDRIMDRMAAQGYGLWALEERASGRFLGFTGFNPVPPGILAAGEPPGTEVGWRLSYEAWGCGYATEAARAALAHAFGSAGLDRVWSFTARTNVRSQAVMRRLGMVLAAEFDHPTLPVESPLHRHVLFRVDRPDAREGT